MLLLLVPEWFETWFNYPGLEAWKFLNLAIFTTAGIFVLRSKRPEMERPYRAIGYPALPVLYIVLAGMIEVLLLLYKPSYTWPGLIIVLLGVPVYFLWRKREVAHESIRDEIGKSHH